MNQIKDLIPSGYTESEKEQIIQLLSQLAEIYIETLEGN